MTRIKIKLCFLLTIISLVFPVLVLAQEESPSEEKLEEVKNQIVELEEKLREVRNKEKTLQSQIDYMDGQINLTILKIDQTEEEIDVLQDQIIGLTGKINRLEGSLTSISEILLNRIVATYKARDISPVYLFFSSNGFSEFLSRAKYIQVAQAHDKKLMFAIQSTKNSYQKQKDLREEKKKQLEVLQEKLEEQKLILAQQRADKAYLLEVTRQDEKRYQELLAAARSEQAAIEQAIKAALDLLIDGTPVDKGDQIALIGNSGAPSCSTGAHLHFEIRRNGDILNPADYLKDISVEWDNQPDGPFSFNGDWDWPIGNPRITQGFGDTYWSRTGFYSGRPHTGLDMVSSSSDIIRAPKGGTLYKGTVSCKGNPMNFVAIEHDDGIVSWYWHVQ